MRPFALGLCFLASCWAQDFLQKPYLQLGNHPRNESPESLSLLWHAPDRDARWSVEVRNGSEAWRPAAIALAHRIDVRGVTRHRVYEAELLGLPPGRPFEYRVTVDGRYVFAASGVAPRAPGEPHTFAVVGDTGEGSGGQKRMAVQMFRAKPEYLVIVGDIVYYSGLVSQYYDRHFPIFNCDAVQEGKCAPILRSMTTIAIPGNHDILNTTRLGRNPGALAYFYYWSQPLNGPVIDPESRNLPEMKSNRDVVQQFYDTAPNYPQMAMYSFDWGDSHWLMLDSNSYVDWSDPQLQEWVRKDLAAAKNARWRFVGQHHPAFSSAKKHSDQQWMRQLAPVLEEGGVDVVFAGHVHNYQRTRPLRFRPAGSPGRVNKVGGEFAIDQAFDGKTRTRPDGVIWIVTGGGGASLKNGGQDAKPSSWQPFTVAFHGSRHSFSLVDISPATATIRQIDEDGREIDRFSITR